MAKVSKYQKMVGQMVNDVLVSDYHRLEKISAKSGRKYFRYEVELDNLIWVSTTSFNKGTYGKRLAKAKGQEVKTERKAKEPVNPTPKAEPKPKTKDKAQPKPKAEPKAKTKKPKDRTKRTKSSVWWYKGEWFTTREVWKLFDDREAYDHYMQMMFMSHGSYVAQERAKKELEDMIERFNEFDNMNVYGSKIYNSAQKYYDEWLEFVLRSLYSIQGEEGWLDFDCRWECRNAETELAMAFKKAYEVTYIEEFSRVFKAYVFDHWHEVEDRYRAKWYERHGSEWQQRWEKQSFGKMDFNTNEYDKEFKGLNAKEAKRKMRELSKKLHPDLNPGIDDKGFKDMMAAYDRHMARVA